MTFATDTTRNAVLAADDARLLAMTQGNFEACASLLSEDLVFAHSSGRVDGKKTYVEALYTGKYLFADRSDAVVYAKGDVAWMVGRIRQQVLRGGQQRDIDARFLSVWAVEGGMWRMTAYAATPIPDALKGSDVRKPSQQRS